jgi:hypothetical protein
MTCVKRLSMTTLAVLLVLVATGCGGAQRPRTTGSAWHEVRFKAAALPARRASGAPWHLSEADNSASLLGGIIGLAVGYPEVGFALGSALVEESEPMAPAPYVEVKIVGETYRISPIGRTFAPRWSQPIAIPAGVHAGRTPAIIQVLDAVDGAIIGQRETTVGELLKPGSRTLTDLGDVSSLDIEVRPMEPRPYVAVDLYVDGARSLEELKAGEDERWTAIPVWNGDRITVEAVGRVCPSDPDECFGPEGAEPGRWETYSYDTFAKSPHASLVAVLAGQAVPVGTARTFVAEQAGFLLLFVNDTRLSDNSGSFDVHVDVVPR